MCGICGEVRLSGAPDAAGVRRMADALAHRGPDAEGFFTEGPAALGHRRLSILDLEGGVQPMHAEPGGPDCGRAATSAGGVTLVFNGQIYDHDDVRAELRRRGHAFKTRSDTEVVLRAYLEWGEALPEHLDGMFALAVWDAPRRKLLLARDRLGKKPLYYALAQGAAWGASSPDRLVFGSELKALFAYGVPRELDEVSLVQYLAAEAVPGARSIARDVHKLEPGHVAVFDAQGLRLRRYWELPAPAPRTDRVRLGSAHLPSGEAHEAAQELLRLLDGAVARRLVADVPVGVFLSGGVDSSAVAALATRHKTPLETFSIGFSEASFDETPWARLASERLGTRHQVEVLSGSACLDLLPEAVASLDEPFADPSFLPTLLLSRFTRRHVTVALAGDGGDELFAGYDTFLAHGPARLLARAPHGVHALLVQAASLLPSSAKNMSFDFRVKQFLRGVQAQPSLRHASWIAALLPSELRELLVPELRAHADEAQVFAASLADARRAQALGVLPGSVDEALRYYLQRYLVDDILVKADRASMAASLELRAPFLDTKVVEFAARLPSELKLSGTRTKALLKAALQGVVPHEILERPKKGFGIPVAAWLRGPLRPLVEELFAERALREGGLFEPGPTRALLQRHLAGQADLRKPLWALTMFLLWRRQWGSPSRTQSAAA